MIFLEKRIQDMYKYIEENDIVLTIEEKAIIDLVVKNARNKNNINLNLPNGIVKSLLTTFRLIKIEK